MKKILVCLTLLVLLFLAGCSSSVYEVKFLVDGSVVSTQQIKKGDDAIAPADPVKEGHIFTGWDKEFTNVKENIEVNAVFDKETFTVKFYDENDNLLKEEKVVYGESANAPDAPAKEGYKFTNWDIDFSNVTEEIEVRPVYERLKYTVIFQEEDGTVLKEMTVAHGNTASFTDVKKPGYKFMGWDKDTSSVTEDMTVTAKFELEVYTITYKDEEGNVIEGLTPSSYTINDGASITLPSLIEKEGYECLGWHEGNTRVATFFASDAVNKEFVIKYKELPKPLEIPADCTKIITEIEYVNNYPQPKISGLGLPSSSKTAYNWESLHPNIVTCSQFSTLFKASPGFGIIRGVYKEDPTVVVYLVVKTTIDAIYASSIEEANKKVEYEVTFTDENGNVINTQKVQEGKTAELPTPPAKEGYTFVGWSGNHFYITENITLEPTYVKGTSDFVGKTVSILGDSISTYNGYNPDGYSTFYPYTSDLGDVGNTWWMKVINNLGMKLLKNNSWGGTCVASGTGAGATVNDDRLKELLFGTETPDIIIIYMGNNDCASQFVKYETFVESYKTMLDKIKVLCPDSEIYLMGLTALTMFKEAERVKYVAAIEQKATEYSLPYISLDNVFTVDNVANYLCDSAHPNKAGMDLIAKTVIAGMLKHKGIE